MRAVAALRLAGFSSGRGDCARGGRSARRGGSRAGLCSSCAGRAILSECRVFVRAHYTFLSKCRAFDHACCLPPVRQTGRLAGGCVPIPPWVVIAGSAFSDVAWLSGFVGSLRVCAFSGGDPDGERKGRGERSRRRGVSALLREHIGFEVFSVGSPLGAARPQTCAKEPLALWTLFIWVVMWVRFTRRRALGYNGDLPNSNLWFGKSCGHTIAPTYASL